MATMKTKMSKPKTTKPAKAKEPKNIKPPVPSKPKKPKPTLGKTNSRQGAVGATLAY